MRLSRIAALIALTAAGALASASGAGAAPTDPFQYQYSIDGSDLPGGLEKPGQIVVNHATGNILVLEPQKGRVDQFDPEGHPVDFPALDSPTISVSGLNLALVIDNTGGPTQGNIYVHESFDSALGFGGERLWSFAPDGSPLGEANPNPFGGGLYVKTIGVLPDGTLEVIAADEAPFIVVIYHADQLGKTIGPKEPFVPPDGNTDFFGGGSGGAFDELGNVYLPVEGEYGRSDVDNNYVSSGGKTGLPAGGRLAFDPTNNDVYARRSPVGKADAEIVSVPYSDPLTPATPTVELTGLRPAGPLGGAFAFDATAQTVYVSEGSEFSVYHREPAQAPAVSPSMVIGDIGASTVALAGQLRARGAQATYSFEYGTDTTYGSSTPATTVPLGYFPVGAGAAVGGLQPGTTYHVRLAASSSAGTTYGPDRVFKTYSVAAGGSDPCPNALARKQTGSRALLDCRAYELVSAADTGGYDVESYLAPGQTPFAGYPLAKDRVLYATNAGAIPGPWNATNNGPDPYLATRTAGGWTTEYKGLSADINPAAGSFSSVLGEADSSLGTLAFAGQNLCSPCFSSGLETGIPLRLPNGQLVQGMSGSQAAGVPASATPEGKVAKLFSGDGTRLLFASKYAFEPGANTGGDLTVYDRNLATNTTQIVSTDENGDVLGGTVSELDVSADGARIVTATKTGEDAQGNELTHPYLHIGSSPNSVDLAPGATSGVLFAGMTTDGSNVFFTTKDELDASDTDAGADLYEASVDSAGNLDLSVIAASDDDACSPVANTSGEHWNTGSSTADCSVVAIAGGGGVAAATGAIYLLSPEQLDGTGGTLNQPNLYLVQHGAAPAFIATLEPGNPLVVNSVKANAVRRTGDFQVTAGGDHAAFTSNLPLTGTANFGFRSVFLYDADGGQLACASCDTSGGTDGALADDAALAPDGLSLLADGRVFFTTGFPLVLADTNRKKDIYEWSDGARELISAGSGPFDSGLLSASADGTDVFFFTHDALAPQEDLGGQLMKVYDAREGGGFFKTPPSVSCQASDECHGPGTVPSQRRDIRSSGKSTTGNLLVCPKNRVKKHGKCVKKRSKKKKHTKRKKQRGGRNA